MPNNLLTDFEYVAVKFRSLSIHVKISAKMQALISVYPEDYLPIIVNSWCLLSDFNLATSCLTHSRLNQGTWYLSYIPHNLQSSTTANR